MSIALIADKSASHIFPKDVERTEEGKAEGRSSFFPATKSRGNGMTALIRSMQTVTTYLKRKKSGGEDSYLATYGCGTFHYLNTHSSVIVGISMRLLTDPRQNHSS